MDLARSAYQLQVPEHLNRPRILMIDLAPIAELLENMGIKHAPEQRFLDSPGIDGRYVCLKARILA
jgi:hypothetical protein